VKSLLSSHQQAEGFIETPITPSVLEAIHEADEPLVSGETIGVYKILKQIGHGGMGAVYLAARADQTYEKHVAIKLLKRGMDTKEILRHFRNERQILADFDHPNIARLLDGGTTESGLPYFIMEYVEGLPIDRYCDHRRLTVNQRLELFLAVCSAVSYAHRHLVIHRDIKPSNIVLTTEGMPKLLDFGVAKILDTTAQAGSTATGIRLMTPEYASPEQAMGFPVTTASDVYALGIVLYELLTGHSPFHFSTRSPVEVARIIQDTQPLLPSAAIDTVVDQENGAVTPQTISGARDTTLDHLRRRLRGDLDNIVLMAIRKEAERRYQSVEQLSEDIHKHLHGLPVLARKDTIAYRMTKFAKRNRIAVAAGILVLLSLLAGAIATTWQAQKAKAEQARAEYAREFADETRYIETLLLSTFTAPLHDTRQDVKRARNRLKQIEQSTLQGGEWAYGSGNNALGIGYLLLKDHERAKVHLEKAWNSGYQEPSTAYALGKVLGILYEQALTDADQVTSREMKQHAMREAEIKYAQPAIQYLARTRKNAESPAYVEGLIALYQKRFKEALEKTSQALQLSSRPYEVIKLQGDIHFAIGREAAAKGDVPSALKSFSLAGNAYGRATESARSDQDIYLSNAQRIIRTISLEQEEALKQIRNGLELCDKAIGINPDSDRPFLYKSQVYFQQGINQMYHSSKNPTVAFQLAIKSANEAIKRKASAAAYEAASGSYLRIAEYLTAINADPRDALKQAIAQSQQALQIDSHYAESFFNLAGAYFYMGEYQLEHGEDPTAPLEKVIALYDKDLRFISKDAYAYNLLGLTYLGLAEYKLKRGIDSRTDLEKAISNYHLGLRNNPNATQLQFNLGLAFLDKAKYEIDHGTDPNETFEQAIFYHDQGLKKDPEAAFQIFNLGTVYVSRAEYELLLGEDPEPEINNALKQFKRTLELYPDLAPAVLQTASVHLLQARHNFAIGKDPTFKLRRAKEILTRYEKQDPSNAEAHLMDGRIQFLSARWEMKNKRSPENFFDHAIAHVEKCIELNQQESAAFLELASIYRRRAEWMIERGRPAIEWIEQGVQKTVEAEKINPQDAETLAIRSTLLKLKSREVRNPALAKQAEVLLQRALQSNRFLKSEYD
jgi:serine/threonine protein kinase